MNSYDIAAIIISIISIAVSVYSVAYSNRATRILNTLTDRDNR